MANLVEYVKTVWENGKTALNAARMNNMEQGISDCATQINKLGDSVSQKVLMGAGIKSANILQNVTSGGREPIMIRVQANNGADYALCIHLDMTIELYDYASKRSVWSANISSLCQS